MSKQSPAPNQVGKQQGNAGTGLISHQVEYQCGGFVEKNRDAVPEELVGLLRASKVRATASRGCVGQSLDGLWAQEPRAGMMMVYRVQAMQGKSLSVCWRSPVQHWPWSGCPEMWALPTPFPCLELPQLGGHLAMSLRGLEGPAAARSLTLSLLSLPYVSLSEGKGLLGGFLSAFGKVPISCT